MKNENGTLLLTTNSQVLCWSQS